MPASPARLAAFAVLLRVERESAYADELLHSSLLDPLSAPDRNLATEIVMGVLRWRPSLDNSFASLITIPLSRLDLEVRVALRIGAYQLRFLDRMPERAIVNETVELVKSAKKRSAAGMVNAVMRKLAENRSAFPVPTEDLREDLSVDYAHPAWIIDRWIERLGLGAAESICRFDQEIPVTALRIVGAKQTQTTQDAENFTIVDQKTVDQKNVGQKAVGQKTVDQIERSLEAEGIRLVPGALLAGARRVLEGDVTKTRAFREGSVAIQDEGSQLIAALVGKGMRILDCCAAPGSKTSALASYWPDSEIFATEIHPHRAALLRQMVLRQMAQGTNVAIIVADACRLPFRDAFESVLVDSPCSGTGTLAHNPEIKWKLKAEDLQDLQARQREILASAMRHVAPGGRLIYSTCSLEREENQDVVEACLKEAPQFRLLSIREELSRLRASGELVWSNVDDLCLGDFLRTIPGIIPCDGFFAAVLEKIAL